MELRLQSLLTLVVALAAAVPARADVHPLQTQIIKQFPLDERTVYEIPISRDAPTTLMFPSALTAIEAANVSTSAETPAPVLLAYTPGQYFFSVRALNQAAKAAVNVVWRNKTYVIHFVTGAEPYGSVTFYEDELAGRSAVLRRRVTPEVLLGLLDRAKGFGLVAQQYPEAVQQIEHATPGTVSYYRDFRVTVDEVFRFDPEDTLVFKLRFENTGDKEVVLSAAAARGACRRKRLLRIHRGRRGHHPAESHDRRVLRHHWHAAWRAGQPEHQKHVQRHRAAR